MRQDVNLYIIVFLPRVQYIGRCRVRLKLGLVVLSVGDDNDRFAQIACMLLEFFKRILECEVKW